MPKMRVHVVFEFDADVPREESLPAAVQGITEACETMRVGFDAQGCWVDAVTFVGSNDEEDEE